MAGERQRFCPVCDHVFVGGEAVLRCGVCGLLHHPACWVRNPGCSGGCAGADQPEPLAYEVTGPPVFPHPAEGTRIASQRAPGQPLPGAMAGPDPVERVTPVARESGANVPAGLPRIRAATPPAEPHVIEPPPRAQRGRLAGGAARPPVDDLRLYRRHEFLRYWYVPVAALLAILVAVGVIWGADQLFGGGGGEPATPAATATPSPTVAQVATATTPAGSPGATTTGTPVIATGTRPAGTTTPAAGNGARAVVATGGDCLNIRTGPGTSNPAVDCLAEGTVVTLTGESEASGGVTWVRIQSETGHDGWVSDEFLKPQ